jgi:hypothetical protein
MIRLFFRSKKQDLVGVVRVCILENQTASKLLFISIAMVIGGILFIVLAICGGFF